MQALVRLRPELAPAVAETVVHAALGAVNSVALHDAGFSRTRAVFQLWNPNFRPSRARPPDRKKAHPPRTPRIACQMRWLVVGISM